MFTSRKKMNVIELEFLNMLYDYCLDPHLTERERKIGLMAKQDLEKASDFKLATRSYNASFNS